MENRGWKRLVFLDIDGVVNSDNFYAKTKGLKGNFDPDSIALLNQLKDTGAEVVVSSSWGEDGIRQLKAVGLELPIIGHTRRFHEDWMCRGNEIEKWLVDNHTYGTKYGSKYYRKAYEYVIFDDDRDMLLGQMDNFIHVDRKTGVTQEDIDKARAILERKAPEA